MDKNITIVVTYNRLKLLKENIDALKNQTQRTDILIVDNDSTDGTKDFLNGISDKSISYIETGSNIGGSGGFSLGVKYAIEHGYQYAWLMDDDAIPKPNALEALNNAAASIQNKFSYLASLVYWTDSTIFEMNLPAINNKTKMAIEPDTIRKYKIMPITAASFVGCFVNLAIAKTEALPIADFFIYGDDYEYTTRLGKHEKAYIVFDSIIVHKAPSNKGASIVDSDSDRIQRFYYQSRNGMYIARRDKKVLNRWTKVFYRAYKVIRYSKDNKIKRLNVLFKGTIDGLRFSPDLKYTENKIK